MSTNFPLRYLHISLVWPRNSLILAIEDGSTEKMFTKIIALFYYLEDL